MGTYTLVFLPLDGRLSWPEDPAAAWAALPPREYLSARGARPAARSDCDAVTGIQILRGPRFAHRGLGDDREQQAGQLSVSSKQGTSDFVIGAHALRSGVLLGRYDRCDNAGLSVLSDHRVSRVHLLLLEIDEVVYAIDTASTNGVWLDGAGARHRSLDASASLELGDALAHVAWSPRR